MRFLPFQSLCLAILFFFSITSAVFAQANQGENFSGGDTHGISSPDVRYDPDQPVPYDPDEFPRWARDLRRGEVIALGAFPVAMIVASLGYEIGRFGYQSIRQGAPAGEYAPWFFSTSQEESFTNEERIGLVFSSAIIGAGIAIVDYILGRRQGND